MFFSFLNKKAGLYNLCLCGLNVQRMGFSHAYLLQTLKNSLVEKQSNINSENDSNQCSNSNLSVCGIASSLEIKT